MSPALRIETRLRPYRILFVVCNVQEFLRAIEANTALWGGEANFIAYHRAETPLATDEGVAEWVRFSDPDLRVEVGAPDIREQIPIDDADRDNEEGRFRIWDTELDEILDAQGRVASGVGCGVAQLYDWLHAARFQFTHKREPRFVYPATSASDPLHAAVTGRLPSAGFNRLAEQFEAYFQPDHTSLDDLRIYSAVIGEHHTPLTVGMHGISRERLGNRHPLLLLFDQTKVEHLILYWNMRAWGHDVLPINAANVAAHEEICLKFVLERSRDGRPALFPQGDIVLADPSLTAVGTELQQSLQSRFPPGGGLTVRPWRDYFSDGAGYSWQWRRAISAQGTTCSVDIVDGQVSFATPMPQFASPGGRGSWTWANVVKISGRLDDGSSFMLPPQVPSAEKLLSARDVRIGTEGIVVACSDFPQSSLAVPDGTKLFLHFATSRDHSPQISGAGRLQRKLAHVVGGPSGMDRLANAVLLQRLDAIAGGFGLPEDSQAMGQTRRSVGVGRFRQELAQALKSDDEAGRTIEWLLQRGALAFGVNLRCEECGQQSWHPLKRLDDSVECERCLTRFGFPRKRPLREDAWAYRTRGIFTVENCLQGAYCSGLVSRWFAGLLWRDTSWAPACELHLEGRKVEIDLSIFVESSLGRQPRHVLVECKSFGKGPREGNDLAREEDDLRFLARAYPEAVLAFATMAPEIDEPRRMMLLRLSKASPVLVLTGTELFASEARLPQTADDGARSDVLEAWCLETQRRHLAPRL